MHLNRPCWGLIDLRGGQRWGKKFKERTTNLQRPSEVVSQSVGLSFFHCFTLLTAPHVTKLFTDSFSLLAALSFKVAKDPRPTRTRISKRCSLGLDWRRTSEGRWWWWWWWWRGLDLNSLDKKVFAFSSTSCYIRRRDSIVAFRFTSLHSDSRGALTWLTDWVSDLLFRSLSCSFSLFPPEVGGGFRRFSGRRFLFLTFDALLSRLIHLLLVLVRFLRRFWLLFLRWVRSKENPRKYVVIIIIVSLSDDFGLFLQSKSDRLTEWESAAVFAVNMT